MVALHKKDCGQRQAREEKSARGLLRWSLIILAFGWTLWLGQAFMLPDVRNLAEVSHLHTAFMRQVDQPTQAWRPLAKISPHLQRAVIVAEDANFYDHDGFEWEAIRSAWEKNLAQGRLAFGGSTITQQLAKNIYLSPSKNPLRKLKELLIALRMEQELSKARILELYLNVVEWAPGIYGAEAAAQHYFGRSARRLSRPQAAFLASILPSPRRLGAQGYQLTKKARRILRRM